MVVLRDHPGRGVARIEGRIEGSADKGKHLDAACGPAWTSHRGHCSPFLSGPQHLQEDRDGLHTTAELLQVRVQSLMHILTIQEEELSRKVGPLSPGAPCGYQQLPDLLASSFW